MTTDRCLIYFTLKEGYIMKKTIESFKKELKSRIILSFVLSATICIVFILKMFVFKGCFNQIPEFKLGFITGLCSVIAITLFILGIQSIITLRNDEKLKAAFAAENDERLAAIKSKAGQPLIIYTSEIMIVAGIIIKDYSVSQTLFIAAICQLLASLIIKIICCKTM